MFVWVCVCVCACLYGGVRVCVRACTHAEKLQRPLNSCQCSIFRGSCPNTPSKHFPVVRTMPGWDEHKDSFPSRWWASKGLESALWSALHQYTQNEKEHERKRLIAWPLFSGHCMCWFNTIMLDRWWMELWLYKWRSHVERPERLAEAERWDQTNCWACSQQEQMGLLPLCT